MKAYLLIDMQFGSTGKGLLAGYLAKKRKPDTVVTAWGPNAGHTFIDKDGRKFVHTMLANGIVSPNLKRVLIGAGTVLNTANLNEEISNAKDLLQGKEIIIHPQCVIVTDEHRKKEAKMVSIGSTMKGTGQAIIDRIERDPNKKVIARDVLNDWADYMIRYTGVNIIISRQRYHDAIKEAKIMQIEGAQGYSLSIYHGMYPYTTSRDVTPHQVMADCGLPYSIKPEIIGTLRTYPIRVSNRYDKDGNKIGSSGGCYADQHEIQWEDIGIEPELTTVTQLPRRIFTFSIKQLVEANFICSPDKLFLNFANYLTPAMVKRQIDEIQRNTKKKVIWVGHGATEKDIEDIDITWRGK